TTALDATQGRRPGVTTGEVDDNVDAAVIGAALRLAILLDCPFRPIEVGVINHLVGSHFLQTTQFFLAGCTSNHLRAQQFGKDDTGSADAAAGAEDQNRVALFNGVVGDEHSVRGAISYRKRSRLDETNPVWDAD